MRVVRHILEMVAAGASISSVVKHLNRSGVKGPRSVLYRKGGMWTRAMIRDHILRNDFYLGTLGFGRPEGSSSEAIEMPVPDVSLDPEVVRRAASR